MLRRGTSLFGSRAWPVSAIGHACGGLAQAASKQSSCTDAICKVDRKKWVAGHHITFLTSSWHASERSPATGAQKICELEPAIFPLRCGNFCTRSSRRLLQQSRLSAQHKSRVVLRSMRCLHKCSSVTVQQGWSAENLQLEAEIYLIHVLQQAKSVASPRP